MILFEQILQRADRKPAYQKLIGTTIQNLWAAGQRTEPNPSELDDDARIHTNYDRMHGRERRARGGLVEASPPRKVLP